MTGKGFIGGPDSSPLVEKERCVTRSMMWNKSLVVLSLKISAR